MTILTKTLIGISIVPLLSTMAFAGPGGGGKVIVQDISISPSITSQTISSDRPIPSTAISDSNEIIQSAHHRSRSDHDLNPEEEDNDDMTLKDHNWSTSRKNKKPNRNGILKAAVPRHKYTVSKIERETLSTTEAASLKAHEGVVSEYNNHDSVDSKENPYTLKEKKEPTNLKLRPNREQQ